MSFAWAILGDLLGGGEVLKHGVTESTEEQENCSPCPPCLCVLESASTARENQSPGWSRVG